MFQPEMMDFTKSKTFTAKDRHNLVRIDKLRTPGIQDDNLFESEEFSIEEALNPTASLEEIMKEIFRK